MIRPLLLALTLLAGASVYGERVRVIVSLEPDAVAGADRAAVRPETLRGLDEAKRLEWWGSAGRTFTVEIEAGELAKLESDPRVRAVFIDDGGEGALGESLAIIGMQAVRSLGFDGAGTTVAILDTGIDSLNVDFAGRIAAERCFCDNLDGTGCCPDGSAEQSGPGSAMDDHGHGTHVAGILAGGGISSPAGVAPAARIIAIKVMDHRNSFRSFTQIFRALTWIVEEHPEVDVINMSLGSYALMPPGGCDESAPALGLASLVATLRDRGVLIAASSGNQGSLTGATVPACMAPVIGVGATYDAPGHHTGQCTAVDARVDQVTCFTNSTASVDILAPGATIGAAAVHGGMIQFTGTSMAAPHVAGTLALMKQANGALTAEEAIEIVMTTGIPVVDERNGLVFPRLDAARAVARAADEASPGRRRSVPR